VSSYLTISTLPVNAKKHPIGGVFSVALILRLPAVRVTNRHALRCSDFPPRQTKPERSCTRPIFFFFFFFFFLSQFLKPKNIIAKLTGCRVS